MARQARVMEAGVAFHVTARGNYRQPVFLADQDRAEYLGLLAKHAAAEDLEILGWCCMTNHVHLLAMPLRRQSLAHTMRRLQSEYALRLNRRQGGRSGHLWQSRFYSCPVDGAAVWTVLRYIERNPVRAGLVALAEYSDWSSAAIHCGLEAAPAMLALKEWAGLWTGQRWQSVLAYGQDERQIAAIREATNRGRPLGDDAFVAELERQAGRRLTARPNGRPRQSESRFAAAASPAGGTISD